MKKIALFFASLVVAIASFAAIPTKSDLADFYEPGQLCVCVQFEEPVCNDIVFIGSYNGWDSSDPASMAHFAPLEGFDGWYYVAVTDNSATIEGKPVQLMSDGSFSWDYQGGDADAWTIHAGYVDILPGYNGECDLKNYSTAEPVILTCAYFKYHNTPCGYVAEYQDYTIRLLAPDCAGADGTHYQPAIIGDFNNWSEGVAAYEIDTWTSEYVFHINARVGSSFKFRALGDTDWSNEIILLDEISQYWYAPDNIVLGTDTEISIDYSAGRYALCVEDVVVEDSIKAYTIRLLAPDCAGADGTHYQPAIIGSFNDWTEGVAANYIEEETSEYVFIINDKVGGEFKFKALGDTDWTNEIQLQDEFGNWYNPQNITLGTETEIFIDYSAGRYTFCVEDTPVLGYIVYELNGGVTNDYGWLSKADMWAAFSTDAGISVGTYDEVKAAGDPFTLICGKLLDANVTTIMGMEKWDWLEAYIMEVQNADAAATVLTEGTSSAGWRYAMAAFFLESKRASWPVSADFSQAGKYEAFQPAWKHAFANPTEPTGEWVLNAPYKEGETFLGWYWNADFSGEKVTVINAESNGTLYAKFGEDVPTSDIPTKNDLVDFYEPGQLCVCIKFEEEVCNDIVFIGSYNGWDSSDPASMAHFAPLEGFEGWYYVAVTDESAEIQGKPVQLMGDGSFAWDYQGGDAKAWTIHSGYVDILPGYNGECDLKNYSTAEPVILTCAYFKNHNTPCGYVVEYKDYTIRLNAPFCAGADGTYYDPAIIGDFNNWTEGVAATYIDEKTFEYVFELKQAEKTKAFKFKALGDIDWSNQIQLQDELGNWYDNPNLILGDDTEISIDYSAGRYTHCAEDVVVEDSTKAYTIRLLAPDCAGADGTHYQPAIIGSFNDWTEGVAANDIDDSTDEYVFIITDKVGGEFKFKALGDTDWSNQIQLQDEYGYWYDNPNLTLGTETEISIDYSAGRYTLCVEDTPPTGDIPTQADLAPYYEPGQLCVCIKFEEPVCNDIVFAGSYNGWVTDPAEMAKFTPLEGFEGWYYVAVTDESATIEGKPVQLMSDGSFSWDYQGGDVKAWTIHSGYVDILSGYDGECDLKNYSTAEPVIMTCAYFKNHNTPCGYVVEYKDYTIRLNAPFCAGADGTYYDPAIIGDFNDWTEGVAANYIDEETLEYVFHINARVGSSFKFRALGYTDWSNEIILWDEISQYWYAPTNIVLGTDTEISIDYSAGRYALCVEDTPALGYIVYELNGGVTNDYGWLNKNDMFQACMADCGVTTLGNLDDLKAAGDGSLATICAALTDVSGMMNLEKWDWLEAYIMNVQNNEAGATALVEGTSTAGWRYAVAAFFLEMKRASWPVSADFSQAGKYEAFQPAWKHAFANPTEPTGEWVLNAPYKEGETFLGWYWNADFSGEKVTVINAESNGTLYAKFGEYVPTIAEVKALADDTETQVAGVVNFISGKNVYIQDATGGLLLYMAANPTFQVGDQIIAKGKKIIYGGAPELTGVTEVSAEAAELPTAVAFENLATLIADTEFKHFATRVSVPGLKIVSYDSYNNPTVEDALGNQALCYRMVLDPVEFPIGKKVNITAVAGWYNGFQFVGDAAGIELVPIGVKDQYNYPVRHERYSLTNNWVISNVEDNYFANKPGSTGGYVRGMAAKDGIMYFINRETESLVRVDGATGEMLDPLRITGEHLFQVPSTDAETGETSWSYGVTIPFNDLKFDQAGNCLISGSVTSQNQYFMVYEVDLETGAATLVVSEKLGDNPDYAEIPCRFDAFGVNGDIHGNACIMAADALGSWNVYRWVITNGVVGKAKLIKISLDPRVDNYLATTAAGFGTAPQIFPKDETGSLFYVDGFNTLPMLFNEGGMLVEDFIKCPYGTAMWNNPGDTTTLHTGLNGIQEFQVGDEYFLLMAATHTISTPPSAFGLYKFKDEARSFDGLEPLWYFPANGMGNATNGYRVAVPSVEVNGNEVSIYLYTGDNGYASYTLHVDSAEIVDPSLTDYTIRLNAPDCAGADGTHYQPAIIGTFNDWTEGVAANYIDDKTGEYVFHITDYVGGEFKFKALGDTDWSNEIQLQDELGNWYNPQNLTLGTETEISIDYSAGRYTLCAEDVVIEDSIAYTIRLLAPDCAGADGTHYQPAIIGTFNDWTEGVAANYIDDKTGEYVFHITDKVGGAFKFRALGDTDWSNQIQLYDEEYGWWYDNYDLPLGTETEISIDYSAGRYTLCVEDTPPTGDIPTQADLAPYYEPGQLCVCIKFEEPVCNDIVFAGSYNGWVTDPAEMAHFAPLEGFEGWYYVAVTDESGEIQGKPVQLMSDGSFSWDYQGGDVDAWTIHAGYVDILPGYDGECDLKNYSTAEPVILTCAYFKYHNTPCEAEVYQDYTIRLIAPFCAGADGTYYDPAIIGDFNNWTEGVAANESDPWSFEYVFHINARVGSSFKFRALGDTDWSNQIQLQDEYGYWYDNPNLIFETETEILIDYSAGRYTFCVEDVVIEDSIAYTIRLLAPDCAGADGTHYEPAIIGTFNGWTEGVAANYIDDWTGEYVFHITDKVGGEFKFKALGDTDWTNEIELQDEYGWYPNPNLIFGNDTEISIDYSAGRYTLCQEEIITLDPVYATICYGETYYWNGDFYRESGVYTVQIDNFIHTLYLTVLPEAFVSEEHLTINETELPYIWHNQVLYDAGTYHYYIQSEFGCDSIHYILHLSVEPAVVANQCGDNLYWTYEPTTQELSITGYGDMYDYTAWTQPWNTVAHAILSISLPEGMTSIGASAFADCKFVTNITIPASVEVIGFSAFENCRMLSDLTFAEGGALSMIGNWAFYNCHELQNITIPEGVTEIGYAAFYGCTYLSELTLPASMQYIADNGFALCAKLTSMTVNATVPPTVAARTFEEVDRTIPVYVPQEAVDLYKTAPVWQEFYIVGKLPSSVDNLPTATDKCQKLIRDGQLIILHDGKTYNAMGQEL